MNILSLFFRLKDLASCRYSVVRIFLAFIIFKEQLSFLKGNMLLKFTAKTHGLKLYILPLIQ